MRRAGGEDLAPAHGRVGAQSCHDDAGVGTQQQDKGAKAQDHHGGQDGGNTDGGVWTGQHEHRGKLTGETTDEVRATEVLLSQEDGVHQTGPHSYGPGCSHQASTYLSVHSHHI